MTDRKRPTAGFWITVAVVVVLAGYPLSFGPFLWLNSNHFFPDPLVRTLAVFYWPIDWLYHISPQAVREAFKWYIGIWQSS